MFKIGDRVRIEPSYLKLLEEMHLSHNIPSKGIHWDRKLQIINIENGIHWCEIVDMVAQKDEEFPILKMSSYQMTHDKEYYRLVKLKKIMNV